MMGGPGLSGVARELDRRAHDLRHQAVRLEQQRVFLETAEVEYHKSLETVGTIMPNLQNGSISLMQALQASQSGEMPADLGAQFAAARRACEEQETAAALMTSSLFRLESAWEQYAQSVREGQRVRQAFSQF